MCAGWGKIGDMSFSFCRVTAVIFMICTAPFYCYILYGKGQAVHIELLIGSFVKDLSIKF
ncbi:hypothetical protein D7Y09_04330 [bacterium 1XD42-1]|nr:hypothetical protein D7X25_04445 [bacterium 1XD42-8]RKJ66205.1 hypothetical protein D7Y09_04330 [bacterium 1XD42-1]